MTAEAPREAQAHFTQIIFDVVSRCDLRCPNCNVFEGYDQSWQGFDRSTDLQVIALGAQSMNQYAKAQGVTNIKANLFGGEPLLDGAERLDQRCETIRKNMPDVPNLEILTTTNGIRLGRDRALRETIRGRDVKTKISFDGYEAAHNANRPYSNGRGSHGLVRNAIEIFRDECPEQFAGLQCTLTDPKTDPIRTYDALAELGPPMINFLLDHSQTGKRRPPERFEDALTENTPVGDWLIEAFDHHIATKRKGGPQVRLFHAIMMLCMGAESEADSVGLTPTTFVALAPDGSWRLDSAYNAAYEGAANTGMNVFEHSLDEVWKHPALYRSRLGRLGLSKTCQECPIIDICGGGLPSQRYWNPGEGTPPPEYIAELFSYPSAYCADLAKLILHIKSVVDRYPQVPTTPA